MVPRFVIALLALLLAPPTIAEGERAGTFDYYVLALSWSPTWCALEGDRRNADQCDPKHDHGFTLHGLWPQFERGWPSFCKTDHRQATRRQTAEMADIMGSGGLAWHQWKKHGRCAGLSAQNYFRLAREAYSRVVRPAVFRALSEPVRVGPNVVEAAFLESNPEMSPKGVTVTCRNGRIHEVRICLTRGLTPRLCGEDVVRDCSLPSAEMAPIR